VLDVGVGGGAASLPLVPRAARIVGVDTSEDVLAAFREAADAAGVEAAAVSGAWPDVAPDVELADVAVCNHVLYNVAELEPFARALDGTPASRRRRDRRDAPARVDGRPGTTFHGLKRPEADASDAPKRSGSSAWTSTGRCLHAPARRRVRGRSDAVALSGAACA
jgi:SAM-dependent methyltransferase